MKKAPVPPDKPNKKARKKTAPTHLGQHGFKQKVVVKGAECERKIEAGQHIKWVRCDGCGAAFDTPQGLGGHKLNCAAAKKRKAEACTKDTALSQQLTSASMCCTSAKMPTLRVSKPTAGKSSIAIAPLTETGRKDNQCGNRGSAVRQVHSFQHKAQIIEMHENAEGHPSIAEFARAHNLSNKHNEYLSTSKNGWRFP